MKDVQPPQMAMSNCDDVEQWMVTLTSPALKFDFLLRHNVGVLDVGSKFGGEDRSLNYSVPERRATSASVRKYSQGINN